MLALRFERRKYAESIVLGFLNGLKKMKKQSKQSLKNMRLRSETILNSTGCQAMLHLLKVLCPGEEIFVSIVGKHSKSRGVSKPTGKGNIRGSSSKKVYLVGIREVWVNIVKVEAINSEDARDQAAALSVSGSISTEFSHTLDMENWTVEEVRNDTH
jgi:hypothetical protein